MPTNHVSRHLQAKLDLDLVRGWGRELYAERGRPSIDPVVFFKLRLILFFEGLRSERKLIATAGLHLAHRYSLGDALDEARPDPSSLTRIRHRLGGRIFERFFERVVDLCQGAGLVWGAALFFAATKVRANADLDSLVPRVYHEAEAHVADLFADDAPAAAGEAEPEAAADALPAGVVRLPGEPAAEASPAADPPWRRLEERRLDPHRAAAWGDERTSAWRVSPTDPDATPMWSGRTTWLGCHDHDVVDGGKARIVLAALIPPADVMENAPVRDLLRRVCFRRRLRPHRVIGDTTDGTVEHIVAIEDAGIRAYLPLADRDSRRPASFGQDDVADAAARDASRCPQGHHLRRDTARYGEAVVVSRGDAAIGNAGPVKAACTERSRGRTVKRPCRAAYLERVQDDRQAPGDRQAMRKRQVWVEPLFAEAKDGHGLRRFRLRGLEKVNMQGLLVAAGQNLRRWLAATGWGRCHAPCGSRLARPGSCPAPLTTGW